MASKSEERKEILECGIIMPISGMADYLPDHWVDVLEIHKSAINSAGFNPNLVSDADDVGIIQKRIVQNVYNNPIIICDVSGKNPNVMFELGLRIAFDKPVIIVKDDATDYSFDTAPIEHITYPKDLRFNKIEAFKRKLKEKIEGTYKKFSEDPNNSTFLKHFGEFKIAKLNQTEVSPDKFLIESIGELRQEIRSLRNVYSHSSLTDLPTNKIRFNTDYILNIPLEHGDDFSEIWRSRKFSGVRLNEIETEPTNLKVTLGVSQIEGLGKLLRSLDDKNIPYFQVPQVNAS